MEEEAEKPSNHEEEAYPISYMYASTVSLEAKMHWQKCKNDCVHLLQECMSLLMCLQLHRNGRTN